MDRRGRIYYALGTTMHAALVLRGQPGTPSQRPLTGPQLAGAPSWCSLGLHWACLGLPGHLRACLGRAGPSGLPWASLGFPGLPLHSCAPLWPPAPLHHDHFPLKGKKRRKRRRRGGRRGEGEDPPLPSSPLSPPFPWSLISGLWPLVSGPWSLVARLSSSPPLLQTRNATR